MGIYSLDELVQRWYTEDLTAEQVVGQVLQVLQELARRVEELEGRLRRSAQEADILTAEVIEASEPSIDRPPPALGSPTPPVVRSRPYPASVRSRWRATS